MLDHKKPFSLVGSPALEFEARLPLADIAGYSAVVVMPLDAFADNRRLRFDRQPATEGSATLLDKQLQAAFSDNLRSIDELQDEFHESYDFYAKRADLQLAVGDVDGAITSAEHALRLQEVDGSAYRLGSMLIDQQRLDEATAVLIKRGDNIAYLERLRLAQIAVLQNDLATAENIVEKAIDLSPTDYRGLMFLGTLKLGQGDYELAVRHLRTAAEETGQSAMVHVNLAAAYLALQQESKAIHELRIASHIDGLEVNAVVMLCKLAIDCERYPEALNAIERHYIAGGRSREYLDRAAHVYLSYADASADNSRYYDKARQLLSELVEIDDRPSSWNNLGVIDDRLGKPDKAVRMFSKSFQIAYDSHEDFSLALSNLLVEHLRSRNFEAVLNAADEFFDTGNAYEMESWGKIAMQKVAALEGLKRREEAADYIECVLANQDPPLKDQRQMLSTLAVHHASVTRDKEKLSSALAQVAEMGDDFFDGVTPDEAARLHNNIAFAYLILGDGARARPHLRENRPRVGKDYYITATQGLYGLHTGDLEEGRSLYEASVAIAPNRTEKERVKQRMFFEVARYYAEHGDTERALEAFRKSAKVKYGHLYLHRAAQKSVADLLELK